MLIFTRFGLLGIQTKFYANIYKVWFGGNISKVLYRHFQGLVWWKYRQSFMLTLTRFGLVWWEKQRQSFMPTFGQRLGCRITALLCITFIFMAHLRVEGRRSMSYIVLSSLRKKTQKRGIAVTSSLYGISTDQLR